MGSSAEIIEPEVRRFGHIQNFVVSLRFIITGGITHNGEWKLHLNKNRVFQVWVPALKLISFVVWGISLNLSRFYFFVVFGFFYL